MIVYLSLGSNLGDRYGTIESALSMLSELPKVSFISRSSITETVPFGYSNQPNFLNCTVCIETDIPAHDLLELCLNIEQKLGRKRELRWGPRTIDIDILFYGNKIIESQRLLIPHPGIRHRKYLLKSLKELCPDYIHPLLKRSVSELLSILDE